jgi:cysteine synthase B
MERLLAEGGGKFFNTQQYTSRANPACHRDTTALEIERDIGVPDMFFAGLGTSGSSLGVASYFKTKSDRFKLFGVVSRSDDFLPGIRRSDEMFEVGIFDKSFYDQILEVGSDSAIEGVVELIRRVGVLVGPSSGGSYAAIKSYFAKEGAPQTLTKVVFFACDRVEPYLSYIKKRRPDLFSRKTDLQEQDYLLTTDELESVNEINPEQLGALMEDGGAYVVDTRHPSAFKAIRIPGSFNIPDYQLDELLRFGNPFPSDKKVVFLCRVGLISRRLAALAIRQGCDAGSVRGGLMACNQRRCQLQRG